MRLPLRLRAAPVLALLALAPPAPAAAQAPAAQPVRRDGLPLEPARWARFTATKGTWISLDVSPDGQTIVFDLLGDLYTIPIAGGTATRLTHGLAHDAQPRFSPDGKKIVFVSDRSGDDNVWILTLGESEPVPLTTGTDNTYLSPEWTPDGQYVVVSKGTPLSLEKLWIYHVKGGRGLELAGGAPNLRMLGAAFGPDPRYVWFAQRTGAWQYNAILPQYQLYRYDRETGTSTRMTDRYGSAFRPAISPDGRWLAYGTREDAETGLRLRDLQTGEERWLAYPIQRDDQESRANLDVLPGYSFTPDSRAVVISYGGEIWRVPIDGSAPTRIPFEADVELDIGPEVKFAWRVDTAEVVARQIRSPVPSPDGRRIAFTAFDRLWVQELPDGTPRRVSAAEVGEYHPAWSPDGRWIAYARPDHVRTGDIYLVPAGGGEERRGRVRGAGHHTFVA